MGVYRFTLEKYDRSKKNRYTCPSCGRKKEFTRYIDTIGSFVFPEYVGKCNRVNNCSYHYTPSDFFRDNPEVLEELSDTDGKVNTKEIPSKQSAIKPKETSYIDKSIMHSSCAEHWYKHNNLFTFLISKLGTNEAIRLFKEYNIGTSKKWGSGTVFWYVSVNGKIHSGKIMLYHSNGHRVKEGYSRISWAHTEMNLKNFNLELCFFFFFFFWRTPPKSLSRQSYWNCRK